MLKYVANIYIAINISLQINENQLNFLQYTRLDKGHFLQVLYMVHSIVSIASHKCYPEKQIIMIIKSFYLGTI